MMQSPYKINHAHLMLKLGSDRLWTYIFIYERLIFFIIDIFLLKFDAKVADELADSEDTIVH